MLHFSHVGRSEWGGTSGSVRTATDWVYMVEKSARPIAEVQKEKGYVQELDGKNKKSKQHHNKFPFITCPSNKALPSQRLCKRLIHGRPALHISCNEYISYYLWSQPSALVVAVETRHASPTHVLGHMTQCTCKRLCFRRSSRYVHDYHDSHDTLMDPPPKPVLTQEAPTSSLPPSPPSPRASITEPNPWSNVIHHADNVKSHSTDEIQPLHTPDPSTMDQSIVHGLESVVLSGPTDNRPPQVSQEVLNQFDPLASLEEKAAQEAWQSAEAHPPHPRTPSPKFPALPLTDNVASSPPDTPQSSATMASSSFPSFGALARTFAIPSFSRTRPPSVHQPQPVPSPATLSATFAAQQDTPRNDVVSPSRLSSSGSDTISPAPRLQTQGEIVFDFQNFLDQMKSRSAEPVSKYLRSCVLLVMFTASIS